MSVSPPGNFPGIFLRKIFSATPRRHRRRSRLGKTRKRHTTGAVSPSETGLSRSPPDNTVKGHLAQPENPAWGSRWGGRGGALPSTRPVSLSRAQVMLNRVCDPAKRPTLNSGRHQNAIPGQCVESDAADR